MNECIYNYTLEDNLEATKHLLNQKYKKKTGIVSGFVVLLCIIGMMVSVSMIINKNSNWYIGLLSAVLLVCYFAVDKIAIKTQLKKQKDFYYQNLKKITKIKVSLDENKTITETFYIKEKIIGTNTYTYSDLTAMKIENGNLFLIYKNEKVVMLKKDCLTEKAYLNFIVLKEKFTNFNKKRKIKKN